MNMHLSSRALVTSALLCLSLSIGISVHAEESTLKEDAKKVGTEIGMAARKVGEAGKEVGKKVAETAVEVGHATRDGAKELGKSVKEGYNSSAPAKSASSSATNLHAK